MIDLAISFIQMLDTWTTTNGCMLAMPWTRGDDRLTHYKANPICTTFGVGDLTPIKPDPSNQPNSAQILKSGFNPSKFYKCLNYCVCVCIYRQH